MSEEKLPKEKELAIPATELPDIAPDPLDELIMEMFIRRDVDAIDAMSDNDLQRLADSAADDDKRGTELSGSNQTNPIQLDSQPSVVQMEFPTFLDDGSGETVAGPGRPICKRADEVDWQSRIHSFENFEAQDRINFSGSYRKEAEVGCGGQGVVYRIEEKLQTSDDFDFPAISALKIFSPNACEDLAEFTADMDRMRKVSSVIQQHPHSDIIDIHLFGQLDGVYAMKMQYVSGFDLRRLLAPKLLHSLKHCVSEERWKTLNDVVYSVNGSQQLGLQPAIAVYIIEHVLRGVAALHNRNIVHGDIKPSNIMLNESGMLKIIDIGSAFEDNSPPQRHHFTPVYAAPEFLETGKMSRQSDLASVGYMLIELLSGRQLFEVVVDPDTSTRNMDAHLNKELIRAKQTLPDRLTEILPENILESNHLVELCRRLIDPDLNQRFPTASESIVHRKGTYEFNRDLMLAGLGICNYYEVSQWLANVIQATQ